MASSVASKSFLGASRADGLLGSLLPFDLRKLSSPTVQILIHSWIPKKLEIKAAGSALGNYFHVTTFGESHGGGVACIIDGCPLGSLSQTLICNLILTEGGQARAELLPLEKRLIHVKNIQEFLVAPGAIAKKILKQFAGTEILAYVSQVHKVVLPEDAVDHDSLTLGSDITDVNFKSNIVRCLDPEYAEKIIAAIDAVRVRGDSVGGVVTCIVRNAPRGLGSPVFDKLEAQLAKAAMPLPAMKGFEFGSSFSGTFITGSEHNDEFYTDEYGNIRMRTNRSGGVKGSNGEIINMRIGFKPTSSIARKQTVTRDKKEMELIACNRHDPFIFPLAVPMVKAMVALVLVDQLMAHMHNVICSHSILIPELQDAMKFPKLEPVNMPL